MFLKKQMFIFVIIASLTTSVSFAQPSPEKMLENKLRTQLLQGEDKLTGEGQCWHAAYKMDQFMNAFRQTQKTEYLDSAVQYYDALINKMHTSPDGYKGWVGPYIYDEDYICDVHIGDAILINPMLDFSETVLKHDNEKIATKYEDKAQHYVQLAKKHLIEKWDKRGTWHEDGPYGAYKSWDHYMTSDNLKEWRKLPVEKSNLSLPFNKQNSMGIACLRIYRITGEQMYREKALKIFNFMKSRMCLFRDHYVWNYWEPFGPWDIENAKKNKLRHWVNVHPYRNYQAGEIHEIVEAYHSGLTFTKQDIQRIINTNLDVMWNGDKENPQWHNSNFAVQMAALGEIPIKEPPGGHFPNLAGTLWTGLADFSQTVRELADVEVDQPVSFERKYDELPVTVYQRPFNSNKYFTMAAMIPTVAHVDKECYLVTQIRVSGQMKIELYSKNGKEKITTLYDSPDKKEYATVHIIPWKMKDTPAGDYRVRWSMKDEYREFPIVIE